MMVQDADIYAFLFQKENLTGKVNRRSRSLCLTTLWSYTWLSISSNNNCKGEVRSWLSWDFVFCSGILWMGCYWCVLLMNYVLNLCCWWKMCNELQQVKINKLVIAWGMRAHGSCVRSKRHRYKLPSSCLLILSFLIPCLERVLGNAG